MPEFLNWCLVVALALKDKRGQWLMHRRPLGSDCEGLWEFPGGKVELGESPEDALVREIAEETELVLPQRALRAVSFAQGSAQQAGRQIVLLLYAADIADVVGSAQPRALEGGELGWFTPEQIRKLDKAPLDIELAERLLALDARRLNFCRVLMGRSNHM